MDCESQGVRSWEWHKQSSPDGSNDIILRHSIYSRTCNITQTRRRLQTGTHSQCFGRPIPTPLQPLSHSFARNHNPHTLFQIGSILIQRVSIPVEWLTTKNRLPWGSFPTLVLPKLIYLTSNNQNRLERISDFMDNLRSGAICFTSRTF